MSGAPAAGEGQGALLAALAATWPGLPGVRQGGLVVPGAAPGAGSRANAVRAVGPWDAADLEAALALAGAAPVQVADGDAALAAAVAARGRVWADATVILAAPVAGLAARTLPPVTAFAVWPPLAIQRDLWAAAGIGAARQAVIDRAPAPKAALLGRVADRAAGVGFVAGAGDVAIVHALAVLAPWQRRGLGGWLMVGAAQWAAAQGAATLALAVTRANAPALALYRGLGFAEAGGYRYAVRP